MDESAGDRSPEYHVDETVWVLAEKMSDLLPPVAQLQVVQNRESRAIRGTADDAVGFRIGDAHANEIDGRKTFVSCATE